MLKRQSLARLWKGRKSHTQTFRSRNAKSYDHANIGYGKWKDKGWNTVELLRLFAWIILMTTFFNNDYRNTPIDVSERPKSAWFLEISSKMLIFFSPKYSILQVTHFSWNFWKSKIWARKNSTLRHACSGEAFTSV